MTSEIGRILKCLTSKSYHSLQDDAYTHVQLIPQREVASDLNPTDDHQENHHQLELITESELKSSKIRRPRSAGDISETLHQCTTALAVTVAGGVSTFPGGPSDISEGQGVVSSSAFRRPSGVNPDVETNNNNNDSGGILHFFGNKFKSHPKHLVERGQNLDTSDKVISGNNKHHPWSDPELRYTKFPMSVGKPGGGHISAGPTPTIVATSGSCGHVSARMCSNNTSRKKSDVPQVTPSPPLSSAARHKNKLCRSLDSSQSTEVTQSDSASTIPTDLPFSESQIHFTPQTRTYGHPHKTPVPVATNKNSQGSSSSSSSGGGGGGNFLTNTVSSIGRKVVNSVTQKSKQNRSKLKVKSKSDNNLHRVNSNVNVNSVLLAAAAATGASAHITSRNTSTSNFHAFVVTSDPDSERRLNSVQLGDHASIRLPWTGFQQNNLSTVTTSHRPFIPHTHNNNFDPANNTERYVECGHNSSRNFTTRRRSRSLERCSNVRIFPVPNHLPPTSTSTSNSGQSSWRGALLNRSQSRKESGEKSRSRTSHSLERTTQIHSNLSATEREILHRNIDWNTTDFVTLPQQHTPPPPRRPDKPSIFHSSSSCTPSNRRRPAKEHRPLHRSAPNSSFSNSSESGESSYSAPPSPPPRPASTLKPESRLIIHHPSKTSQVLRPYGTSTMHSSIPQKRTPISLRSHHGSSSDSGVSHVTSSSTSTLRGTSDFSEESAGSVNISHTSVLTTSGGAAAAAAVPQASSAHHVGAPSSTGNSNISAPTAGISLEDVRNSGFINKPTKGWLHSDQMLAKEGVSYTVRYIGCLDVNTSMKSLDFDTRSVIAKECINQVCEAAGLRSQDKKRKIDRRVAPILGLRPRLDHAGSDVRLTITSTCLKLTSLETGAVIAVHDMPNISFASGGDATMLDFVAYVAKDTIVGRACFVLECGSGLAQDVISTVGQAFELRFKEYLQKRPPPPRVPLDDPEYYNDLPGKVPPDFQPDQGKGRAAVPRKNATSRVKEPPPLNLHSTSDKVELIVNLIDFEAPTPPAFGPSVEDKHLDSFLLPGGDQSANQSGANNLSGGHLRVGTGLGLPNSPSQPHPHPKDPFDMQPFATTVPQAIPPEIVETQRRLLEGQNWFHGMVSRSEAEELVKHDGDFLVRESMACPGQFVLTGLEGGSPRHLLLVDPEGVVRTKERTFDNVIHLIRYHSDNLLPIISAESMVLLRNPVPRRVISS